MLSLGLLPLLCAALAPPSPQKKKSEEAEPEEKFKRGDLLEVPRTLFIHFGIYLGSGRVAHFIPDVMPVITNDQKKIQKMVTNTRLILGVLLKQGSVRVDSVEDFAYGSEILVNPTDKVCSSRAPLAPEEVALRAERLRGQVPYSLLWFNCEHYVMYCRYGTNMSFQTTQVCSSRAPLAPEEVALRAERLRGQVPYSLLWFNCEHYVMYCRYGTNMSFQTTQFCKTVRSLVLSRGVAKVMWLLGVGLMLYVHALSSCALLLLLLMPFLVWMAS